MDKAEQNTQEQVVGPNEPPSELSPADKLSWQIEHLDPGEPVSEETLQLMLHNYSDALRQEFEIEVNNDPDNTPAFTHKFFREHMHIAAAQIVHLCTAGETDNIKLNASKFVVIMGNKQADEEGDPIKNLLAELTRNDKKPQPNKQEA